MDQVRPKTFSAWIIPGVIVPPFILTKEPTDVMDTVLIQLALKYGVNVTSVKVSSNVGKKKPIGSTAAISFIRQMFFYFMKDIYKDRVTLQELGDFLGITNHGSVVKAIQTFHGHIETDAIIPHKLGISTVRKDYHQFNEQIRPWL